MKSNQQRQSIVPSAFRTRYENFHYSPAIRVGDIVWVSGQVGTDSEGRVGIDMTEQARFAFDALKCVLEQAGATLADVVELNTFHTQMRQEIQAFAAVKDEYFPSDYPAWTAVGVTELARAEFRIEIRAVAVVGSAGR
ncbi:MULTISPECIES: RidA family protein [Paraburkholderia]|uniref:RidA family protein n=1 Tax=Paraburkholderia TaxID=1822464 RepID=UPI002AB1E279|nr:MULTISPECIES: RidA family protein [Paraburkholderia]